MNIIDPSDIKYIYKQRECDEKLMSLFLQNKCSNIIVEYLILSREHGRRQKEEFLQTPFYKLPQVLYKINEENKQIVEELDNILKSDVCETIRNSQIFNLKKTQI
jgi:hypothetical protein